MIQFPERHPWWLRYAASVLLALAASLVSWGFVRGGLWLHSSFMLTAVVIAAWFGGFLPGITAMLLTIPAQILLRDPVNVWSISGKQEWAGLSVYLLNSLIICFLFRKRYFQRVRTEVSPVAVTGGWMWKYDPADGGTVETQSPEFPTLSATRTLPMWLDTVHPEDRASLTFQIRRAFETGTIIHRYRSLLNNGEVRAVSIFGVKVQDPQSAHDFLVATCLEVGAHDHPERMQWQALPLG